MIFGSDAVFSHINMFTLVRAFQIENQKEINIPVQQLGSKKVSLPFLQTFVQFRLSAD